MKRKAKPVSVTFSHPAINEAHVIGGNSAAMNILKTLFTACGWKVYCHKPKRKRKG